jgi:NAD(P)-binding Rossmann-like domain
MVGLFDLLKELRVNINRKTFLHGSLASLTMGALPSFSASAETPTTMRGELIGARSSRGHKLRGGKFPTPTQFEESDIVIVGGGIAGLAAGYRLAKSNVKNFRLLELEDHSGGNSSSGSNAITAYPWGAHYVPLLTDESRAVRRLFEDLGVITGYDKSGLPNYNEYFLCADPQERLYIYGRWQDGLVATLGASAEDDAQYKLFFATMETYKHQKGSDGKTLFAIPVDSSSSDASIRKLDEITMKDWMIHQGYDSEPLNWYVNYACRDDYGTTYGETSAWAGIHYFASRSGTAANAKQADVVTWPEGNSWLVQKLAAPQSGHITTDALVFNVAAHDDHVLIDYWQENTNRSTRIKAKSAVMATPQFVTKHLMPGSAVPTTSSYAPWAVANITLNKLPVDDGVPLSWDNVVYRSPLLGYVVATHQLTQMNPVKTVLTYYWPLSHIAPIQARAEALQRSLADWQSIFLNELIKVHPDLKPHVERIDICLWGHAMIRPVANYIWGEDRAKLLQQTPPIFSAHSDMSGISIFEEAYTHGVKAAENAMAHLNIAFESVL